MENQFQIALIIHRSIDKKFQSRLLHSKAIKEGFHFATLKWHRLTCYLNWAILIGLIRKIPTLKPINLGI